jgi:hypothetical protein
MGIDWEMSAPGIAILRPEGFLAGSVFVIEERNRKKLID